MLNIIFTIDYRDIYQIITRNIMLGFRKQWQTVS